MVTAGIIVFNKKKQVSKLKHHVCLICDNLCTEYKNVMHKRKLTFERVISMISAVDKTNPAGSNTVFQLLNIYPEFQDMSCVSS